VQIARAMQLDYRKRLARTLAGIDQVDDPATLAEELSDYLAAVFRIAGHTDAPGAGT
jgi:4-hydroxybutyryl-CoA dehydratase/vinylacetyl-CoA-Delta-isomerase